MTSPDSRAVDSGAPKKWKRLAVGFSYLALLLLIIGLAARQADLERQYDKLEARFDSFLGLDPPVVSEDGQIAFNKVVEQSFLENRHIGLLLVLTGRVANKYAEPQGFIRLRGRILDKNGLTLAEQYAYAGNILSDDELRSLPVSEILSLLSTKEGRNGENLALAQGEELPFMLVFDRLPEGMDEYRVDAAGSLPVMAGLLFENEKDQAGIASINLLYDRQQHFYRRSLQGGRKFLVITGLARNDYAEPRRGLRLRGVALAHDGRILADRFVYAGNFLSEEELSSWAPFEIEACLSRKNGRDYQNSHLASGQTIPFMLVFDNLPEGVVDFRVDPVSSEAVY